MTPKRYRDILQRRRGAVIIDKIQRLFDKERRYDTREHMRQPILLRNTFFDDITND